MRRRPQSGLGRWLERVSHVVTARTGSSWAFGLALLVVLVWLATGPLFGFSDTWQLVINTGTTVVTFLMVFLIQRKQNELVAAMTGASNRLIDVESLNETELERLHQYYRRLAEMAKRDVDLLRSHSIEEAETRHRRKHGSPDPAQK